MSNRYFLAENLSVSEVWLTDQEAHHLLHVMRAKVGEQVELFDGRGHAVLAEVRELHKKKVLLRIAQAPQSQTAPPDSPLSREVILATAVPKGDRFRWLIEKATELGVTRLVPLNTARAVVTPRESKLDKHQQYVIEACKQSGRNTLLELAPLTELNDFLTALPADSLRLVGSPQSNSKSSVLSFHESILTGTGSIIVFIGPEGGFTENEHELLIDQGGINFCCAPHILRTETAGIALCAYLSACLMAAREQTTQS